MSLSAALVFEIPPSDCNHSVISSSENDTAHPKRQGRKTTCTTCHQPLHLENCVDEQHFGLGSIYSIVCFSCQNVTLISSGKRHTSTYGVEDKFTRKSSYTWDVNTKLASGMFHTGLGTTAINALLACLNTPGISPKSLKAREREVGRKVEETANKSCEEYAAKEIELCNNEGVKVSFDAEWQKSW